MGSLAVRRTCTPTPSYFHYKTKIFQKNIGEAHCFLLKYCTRQCTRGGVEDTRLEAKAKDTKKIRGQGQGQPFRGQTLSRPRAGMLEFQGQGTRTQAQVLSKKKKVFTKIFQAISTKKRFPKNFSSASQNFNNSKNTAVLEPRTGQFSRT